MPEFKHCPHCDYQLQGDMKDAWLYQIPGLYDGWVFWMCPDCGGMWHRWDKGQGYRDRVDRWLTLNPEFERSYLLTGDGGSKQTRPAPTT